MTLSDKAVEVAARKLVSIYGGNPDEDVDCPQSSSDNPKKVPLWTLFSQSVYEFSAMQEALKAGVAYDHWNSKPTSELKAIALLKSVSKNGDPRVGDPMCNDKFADGWYQGRESLANEILKELNVDVS